MCNVIILGSVLGLGLGLGAGSRRLGHEEVRAARHALLEVPHIASLTAFVRQLRDKPGGDLTQCPISTRATQAGIAASLYRLRERLDAA